MQKSMRNNPSHSTSLTASAALRAAGGQIFEGGQQRHPHGKRGLLAVLLCRACCSSVRGRPGHHAASRTSTSSSKFVHSIDLAACVSLEMAFAVAQDGQVAGTDARKGGARPARVRGPFMAFIYRFFRTFCYHVLWPPRRVLVCMMGMLDRLCLSVSDILRVTLVACAQRTSRGSFAFACVAAHRPRQFNVWIVEKTKQILGLRTSSALRSGHGRSPRRSMGGPPDRGNII